MAIGTPVPKRPTRRAVAVIVALVVTTLALLSMASKFLVDWVWFSAIGYPAVFWTLISTKACIFVVVFIASAAVLLANGFLALRLAKHGRTTLPAPFAYHASASPAQPDVLFLVRQHLRLLILAVGGILGLLIAAGEMTNWDEILRLLFQVPYGQRDPVFNKDIGFYLFSLPAYVALKNWMMLALVLSTLVAGAVYWVRGDIELDYQQRAISWAAVAHGSALLGLFFAVKTWSYALERYSLLYDDNGVLVGASYTDVTVIVPILWLMIALSVIAAVASWANLWLRSYILPGVLVALVFGSSFVLAGVFPVLFQRVFVNPNELELERPYIQRSITLTQEAYDLRRIKVKSFPADQNLTFESLKDNQATINNIRLWDWQPLMDTYRQLQEIRTYYRFHDVDVDRYSLDGSYQQVTLAARELSSSLLPVNAQTWVNRHVLFTHGNGAIMSAVTRKSTEGLPILYLADIPPVSTGGTVVTEPRIYYGELTEPYVFVKGSTPEFDYPLGKDNVYAWYDGAGGVSLSGIARKVLFAWYFGDPNILISRYITDGSRVMFRRRIEERVHTIAPFLRLDSDPYLVVSEGRLFWIQDAYTTSSYFPYAQSTRRHNFNYIRNSVKVVIDAYNGFVDFYIADRSDPIAATYRHVFPSLFKPLEAMPLDLLKHIRYPEDLFSFQAEVYRTYHMGTPEVFYNREDLWQFPRQPDPRSPTMTPYYMIMRLPGEAQAEFILMVPMVPSQRENMIAWVAARCDPPHYGELIAYEFPKDKLVFGPFQIEARINQNTAISQQLSLWNQQGSRVIRGALHAIPIDNSILYVSPLYLRAESGQIPELKRVIAAYGDQVVMEETLAEALAVLFKPHDGKVGNVLAPTTTGKEALDHYYRAMERLKLGDWAGFGGELDQLRAVLEGGRIPR